MDFQEYLQKHAQLIELRQTQILDQTLKDMSVVSPVLGRLFKKFSESSQGGKRIRGALVLLGYEIAGGKNLAKIIDAAVAFEIFQTAILAQDDVIDKSLIRRTKPSLYSALGGDHKAVSETICLSDLGFFLSFDLLSALKIEPELKVKAINLFSKTLTKTVLGEMLDIETPFLERDFSEADSLNISLLKTAAYTIAGPLLLGATLAGADSKTLNQLKDFGGNLGIAFQIQDDILGIFGEENKTGKSNLDDIKDRKATLMIAYAQKNADLNQKDILRKYYGDVNIDSKGLEKVRDVFIETGALQFAKTKAEQYFQKAKASLKQVEGGVLYSLIDFLKKRDF